MSCNSVHAFSVQDLTAGGISLRGSSTPAQKQRSIVFVLGGPGSGKGTQVRGCHRLICDLVAMRQCLQQQAGCQTKHRRGVSSRCKLCSFIRTHI